MSNEIGYDVCKFQVVTFFMTSEEIPYPLLRKKFKEMMFLDYKDLRDHGFRIVEEAFVR
ncbi:MAG: hypothetical protein OEQ53_11040 [Saprospiraceae bacterium]|nr:hypothetical protein [Saprospiraceae bacterium]